MFFEEYAEMGLVMKTQLVAHLLYCHFIRLKQCAGLHYQICAYPLSSRPAAYRAYQSGQVLAAQMQLSGIKSQVVMLLEMTLHQLNELLENIFLCRRTGACFLPVFSIDECIDTEE